MYTHRLRAALAAAAILLPLDMLRDVARRLTPASGGAR